MGPHDGTGALKRDTENLLPLSVHHVEDVRQTQLPLGNQICWHPKRLQNWER